MRTAVVLVLLVFVSVALFGVAGCGSDNGSGSSTSIPTPSDVSTTAPSRDPSITIPQAKARQIHRKARRTIKRVDKICKNVGVSITTVAIDPNSSPAQIHRQARRLATEYERAADQFDAIGAQPSRSRAEVGGGVLKLAQQLHASAQTAALVARLSTSGSSGDPDIKRQIETLNGNASRIRMAVRRDNFKQCK